MDPTVPLPQHEQDPGEDEAPAAKRPRLVQPAAAGGAEDFDWASAFGKKKEQTASAGRGADDSHSQDGGGGWTLRNWSQEREAQRAAFAAPAAPEEDWSFFYTPGSPDTSSSSSSTTPSSSSSPSTTTTSSAPIDGRDDAAGSAEAVEAGAFKVPKGRPSLQKRVSFSREVQVVTIPSRRAAAAIVDDDTADDDGGSGRGAEDFDDEGNPLNTGAGIEDLEGGDLIAPDEEGAGGRGDETESSAEGGSLLRSLKESGAEGLIQYLMSSVSTGMQDKVIRGSANKYFGVGRAAKPSGRGEEAQQGPAKKRFNKETSEALDEDSYLDAFIDDEVAPPVVASDATATEASTLEKEPKKKAGKFTFKF